MNKYGEVEKIVENVIKEVCENEDIQSSKYDNFYEEGILDSVKMMELVIQLEDAFEIEFEGDELYFENFASLDSICTIVVKKMDGGMGLE